MQNPTRKTAVLSLSHPELNKFLIDLLLNLLAYEINSSLDDHIIEWIVPIIAERMERCIRVMSHVALGKTCFNIFVTDNDGSVKYDNGTDKINDVTNNK